jgi:hypothetical protein
MVTDQQLLAATVAALRTLASMVACVSVGPRGRLIPKSATFAESAGLSARFQTFKLLLNLSLQLLLLPGVGLAVSNTLPAFRSPCLQTNTAHAG